jgi:tRNA (cytidine/uridine-2'-O-)-methyltransferase
MTDLNETAAVAPPHPWIHVALLEPEIPPNTGNIARLCAATGSRLHLIGRLGFRMDNSSLRRAGCDFWPLVDLQLHATWESFAQQFAGARIWAFSARAVRPYTEAAYQHGDVLLFGQESKGLPKSLQEQFGERLLCLPMPAGQVRSLNLATAAGIALYEALRQLGAW